MRSQTKVFKLANFPKIRLRIIVMKHGSSLFAWTLFNKLWKFRWIELEINGGKAIYDGVDKATSSWVPPTTVCPSPTTTVALFPPLLQHPVSSATDTNVPRHNTHVTHTLYTLTSAVRYSKIAALYTAAVAPTRPWLVVLFFRCLWILPTGNWNHFA